MHSSAPSHWLFHNRDCSEEHLWGQKRAPRTEEDAEGHTGQLRGARGVPHLPFLSLPTLLAEQRALNLMHSGMSRQFFKLILALLQVGSKEQ